MRFDKLPSAFATHPIFQLRCLFLFVVTLAIIISAPFTIDENSQTDLGVAMVWVFLTGIGGWLITTSVKWLWSFGGCVLISLIAALSAGESLTSRVMEQVTIILVLALTIFVILRYALAGQNVHPIDRVIAAICGYLVTAQLWARFYIIALEVSPGSIVEAASREPITHLDALYFSLVTLSTQGFGDILAVTKEVRILAALEGIFGVLYLAVLIATLVAEIRSTRD
ncbi:MAG: potassium channel family protein [Verrucomicrobiota bacterium]